MNFNLVIANDYCDLLGDTKELSTKSRLLLEKGPAYQFDLSLIELALSFPIMERKVDEMYFLSYQKIWIFIVGNINFTTSKTIK